MKTTSLTAVLATASTMLTLNLSAQLNYKPKPAEHFEIKLPAESPMADVGAVQGDMRISSRYGRPAAIYRGTYRVNADQQPEAQARQYLVANKTLFGLTSADIESLQLHAIRVNEGGTIVRLRQYWKGLPVNRNAEITIHISPDQVVDFVQNGFVYGITMNDVTPLRSAQSAKQSVVSHLMITGQVQEEKNELMLLHHLGQEYLVHRVVFLSDAPVGEWEAFVDAKTGTLLKVEDMALYHRAKKKTVTNTIPFPANLRPQPFLFEAPLRITATGNGTVFQPDPLAPTRKVYRWSGTIGDAGFIDNSDADSPELTAQVMPVTLNDITFSAGTYTLVGPYASLFEYESPAKAATNYRTTDGNFSVTRNNDRFEAVMCYYHVDNQMRHLVANLGLTGLMPHQYTGGVRFDPHGLNGADNSHYTSSNGRFAMGEGGVDDAEDADVIIHELGHGLHDWASVGGLSQVQGLSEGTGDYNSGTYSRSKSPGWALTDSQYNFQYNWDGHNPFFAGRELNYAGVYPGGLDPGGEVHRSGRIWAHANLRIAAAIGRNRSDRVFWNGMMMTNSSSNQNDAAVAVYNMAITLNYTNAERIAIYNSYITAGYTMPALILPVDLAAFDAKKAGQQTAVTWKTVSEENLQSFQVQRSADGTNFVTVGTVNAAGTSTIERNYAFTDALPLVGNNYYRLRSVNSDGSASYSRIVMVNFGKQTQLEIFPNPVRDVLTIRNAFSSGTIYLYDMNGKQVRVQKITMANTGGTTMQLTGLPNGVYMVKVETGGTVLQSKVIKK